MRMLQFPHPIELKKVKKITDEIFDLAKQLRQKPISHLQQQEIFHQQTLKSSLFSARIEGNNLTLVQAKNTNFNNDKQKSKLEISNILKILKNIQELPNKISLKTILSIHKQVMSKINYQAGNIRGESSGIFDGAGNIVYLTPEPKEAKLMLDTLLKNINSDQKKIQQLINSAQCHYYFEKIHPFIDGNGRVGRIILQYQLQKTALFANYILPMDEYFEKNRSDYYFYLEKNTRNIDQFILFFLEGIIFSLKGLIKDIDELTGSQTTNTTQTQSLLPRRQELINITKDHPYISLDSLRRRFPTIPKRTIAYDINWLVKKNFIIKHGDTRGVRYSVDQKSK